MIKAHPWLGLGPEQVSRQIPNYLPAGMPGLRPGEYYGHLENDYVQYAAERCADDAGLDVDDRVGPL